MSFRKNINVKQISKLDSSQSSLGTVHNYQSDYKEEKHNEQSKDQVKDQSTLEKGFIFISDINLNKDVKKAFK